MSVAAAPPLDHPKGKEAPFTSKMEKLEPKSAIIPLFGGLLLGISIIILHFFFKRIAGISGIINSLLTKNETNDYKFNSILFLLGLLLSPPLYGLFVSPINVNIEKNYL